MCTVFSPVHTGVRLMCTGVCVIQPVDTTEDNIGLRAEMHLRVLKAELQNTDENLQSLRYRSSSQLHCGLV